MGVILRQNLLSPIALAFALGVFVKLVRSEFQLPRDVYMGISIYLLLALGLHGGAELAHAPLATIAWPAVVTIVLGLITPVTSYLVLRRIGRFGVQDAAGIAAHYGSVSAVTFIAANQFAERSGAPAEGVLVALLVALEVPALLIGLALGRGTQADASRHHTLREVFTGKTAILLLGGLAIGAIAGPDGIKAVDAMYFDLFKGVLMLFMLDMGILAASRLVELRRGWWKLAVFATALPLAHGVVGVALALACGMSPAGAAVFGAMLSSASYIAAPAAVRAGLPEADVGRCITAALGITFPFNLAIGIPLYAALAQRLAG